MTLSITQIPKAERPDTRIVAEGLGFAEAPRWRDGTLWFSDIANSTVCRLHADGGVKVVCEVPGNAAGLGWLPDGRLLVVSMHGRAVYRLDGDGLRIHADLSSMTRAGLNDMVVGPDGTAYVGPFGYDVTTNEPIASTGMVMIRANGSAEMQTGGLLRPNGCAITPDRATLLVAETRIGRVSSFPIGPDGRLGSRFDMAILPEGSWSDGLALDSKGAVWICDPVGHRVFYIDTNGAIRRILDFGQENPLGCTLGGAARKTLFVTLGPLGRKWDEAVRNPVSSILAIDVDVAGAGWP